MKNIIQKKVFGILFIILMASACNQNIMDYPDPGTFNSSNFFETPANIRQGATAIYSGFYFNAMWGFQWTEMFDALAVEAEPTPIAIPNEPDLVPIYSYTFTNTSVCMTHYWRVLYRIILRSNLVIDKAQAYLDKNGDDASHIVSFSQGEAYFLRGFAYSQLAFYWGRVPIRTTFDQGGNEDAPRAAESDVWKVAENDLKAAQKLLPDSWDAVNVGRATKGAATGYLGKLYLFNKKYAEADIEFAKLDGKYSLLPAAQWMNNFGETNENNQESLFEIQFQYYPTNYLYGFWGSPEGHTNAATQNLIPMLYGFNDWGNWKFPDKRVKDFVYNDENGVAYTDPRAKLTFYGGIGDMTWQDNMTTGPVPFDFAKYGYWYKKYQNKENKVTEGNMTSSNNIRMMRYADVLLMRAECKLNTGDIPGCISYINQVRSRIGAFSYIKSYTQAQAFDLLKRERQIELFGEQHRFDDLKRWKILTETINPDMVTMFGSANVLDKHYLFPIPQAEIDSNLGLGSVSNEWN